MISTRWRLKSPASRLLNQPFIQAQIRENIKAPRHVRGIHRWPVYSPHKGPVTWKMFPFDDVIMILQICHYRHVIRETTTSLNHLGTRHVMLLSDYMGKYCACILFTNMLQRTVQMNVSLSQLETESSPVIDNLLHTGGRLQLRV